MNTRTQEPNNIHLTTTDVNFLATARYVDGEVAKGRALDDVLAVGLCNEPFWFNRSGLRRFSAAVAASFQKPEDMSDDTEGNLRATAHYVDGEVAKGRALEDVLAVGLCNEPFWFNRNSLRPFSAAVAASAT